MEITTISRELTDLVAGVPKAETLVNEAAFGYRYIRPYLDALSPGASVLEIGSGPCLLLSQLALDYPQLSLTGIEPIGPGFDGFDETLTRLTQRFRIDLVKAGYEDFSGPRTFDLIFSINVFEHLKDWRHFLRFVRERLSPGGRCVILCPNYGFPYESHFGLPIVLNKSVTERIFRRRILAFEAQHGYQGLWSSLNFVRWSQVSREAPRAGVRVLFRDGIVREMIERLPGDPAFRARQRAIASMAEWALRLGVVRVLELPLFRGIQPYMHLELFRAETQARGTGSAS